VVDRAIWKMVTLRHGLLAAFTALVLGVAVYLFFEVRAPAAQAQTAQPATHQDSEHDRDKPEKPDPDVSATGSGTAVASRLFRKPPVQGGSAKPTPDREPAPPALETVGLAPHKLDAIMSEANKAYDRSEFDEARAIAQKVLKTEPGNTRMLRILVSSACIEGDGPEAQKSYVLLPPADREAMRTRCSKYGVTFTEPPK